VISSKSFYHHLIHPGNMTNPNLCKIRNYSQKLEKNEKKTLKNIGITFTKLWMQNIKFDNKYIFITEVIEV
jgi:hypothetical protein